MEICNNTKRKRNLKNYSFFCYRNKLASYFMGKYGEMKSQDDYMHHTDSF